MIKFPYADDGAGITFEYDSERTEEETGARMPELEPNGEGFRRERLVETFGAATSTVRLLSVRYRRHWSGAIVHLEDSKGGLIVTWRDEQSRVMFEGVIVGAWEGQAEYTHAHLLAS